MWQLDLKQRLQLLEKRRNELMSWRNVFETPIRDWRFSTSFGSEPIRLGDTWPTVDASVKHGPVRIETSFAVPSHFVGHPVELELDVGGEAFVRLSNGVTGGLNPYHQSFTVSPLASGQEQISVTIEAVPKGLFGTHNPHPRLARAMLVAVQPDVRALVHDLDVLIGVVRALGNHEAAPHLVSAGERIFMGLEWPSFVSEYHARLPQGSMGAGLLESLWNAPNPLPEPQPLKLEVLEQLPIIRDRFQDDLAHLRERYPQIGRMALSGHAHLDLGWLWPVSETRRKARRTFSTVLGLMDRYPDFVFNQSSAQVYAWLEDDDPALFERIRARVNEGRIEVIGGMWVEPDTQMLGGESLVRQLLYGQRYVESRFDQRSDVAWLPDTFGFTGALPQLLREAGIRNFVTTKLRWNETSRFPHDLFQWEGIDGSRVLAHFFWNPHWDGRLALGSYNGDLGPESIVKTWNEFGGKHLSVWDKPGPAEHGPHAAGPVSLYTFGHGDGGGGPSFEMLENLERMKTYPVLPKLETTRVDEFMNRLPREGLPVWVGELYLELHRGTLTTQSRIKKLHREAEHRLFEAEVLACLAWTEGTLEYPRSDLEASWKRLLLTQFHDILPGSSICEVYEETTHELKEALQSAQTTRDRTLEAIAGPGDEWWVVVNPALQDRPLQVMLPGAIGAAFDAQGQTISSQTVEGGVLVRSQNMTVPALGIAGLQFNPNAFEDVDGQGVKLELDGRSAVLENEVLRVEIREDGAVGRMFDKEHQREVLSAPANVIRAFHDLPRDWEAWDVNPMEESSGAVLPPPESVVSLERGPLRAAVRMERRYRDSTLTQTYRLSSGSRRLEIETHLDWHERRTLLRAFFPVRVRSPFATFETAFGVVQRPTHRNMPADAAMFEVSAHRFCDLSEPGYGVSLLNNGRYGHSVVGDTLAMTLIRGSMYPDPTSDLGEHHFTYAIYPHPGDWVEANTTLEAFDLNSPLVVARVGTASPHDSFARVTGLPMMLGALKKADFDNALILRMYEPHGSRGVATLEVAGLKRVERVNLLEDSVEGVQSLNFRPERGRWLEVRDEQVRIGVRPFEVVTLKLYFTDGP